MSKLSEKIKKRIEFELNEGICFSISFGKIIDEMWDEIQLLRSELERFQGGLLFLEYTTDERNKVIDMIDDVLAASIRRFGESKTGE